MKKAKVIAEKVQEKLNKGWKIKCKTKEKITLKFEHLRMTYFIKTDEFSSQWTSPTKVGGKLKR